MFNIPQFEFKCGTIICLHIPYEFRGKTDDLENQLLDRAKLQGKRAAAAHAATVQSRLLALKETSTGWLSRTANISPQEAIKLIAALDLPVAEKLASNAGTPRALLGIAAALVARPDILLYTTPALDASGVWFVHRFVISKNHEFCAVHLSTPSFYGDGSPHPRLCPTGATCFTLNETLST